MGNVEAPPPPHRPIAKLGVKRDMIWIFRDWRTHAAMTLKPKPTSPGQADCVGAGQAAHSLAGSTKHGFLDPETHKIQPAQNYFNLYQHGRGVNGRQRTTTQQSTKAETKASLSLSCGCGEQRWNDSVPRLDLDADLVCSCFPRRARRYVVARSSCL